MPKTHSASINLLKGEDNFFDRFIDWALTVGRFLVILTEIIALSSFIYRFTLDRQIIDLHSGIKEKETLVAFFKDNEENYRNLQKRLEIASTYSANQGDKIKIFQDVLGFAPAGVTFNEISVSENLINIVANFQPSSSLNEFVDSLKSYKRVKNVSIDKIENQLSNAQIVITISADLIKGK